MLSLHVAYSKIFMFFKHIFHKKWAIKLVIFKKLTPCDPISGFYYKLQGSETAASIEYKEMS